MQKGQQQTASVPISAGVRARAAAIAQRPGEPLGRLVEEAIVGYAQARSRLEEAASTERLRVVVSPEAYEAASSLSERLGIGFRDAVDRAVLWYAELKEAEAGR